MRSASTRIQRAAYWFMAPFLLLFVTLKLAPIAFGIYVSFTDWGIIRDPVWVGLENYARIFSDSWVVQVWTNTMLMTLLIVPGTVVASLLMAVYVNRKWPFSNAVRTFVFAPKAVAITVTAMIWVWILDRQNGVLNAVLDSFGIPKIGWLTSLFWVIPSIAGVTVWWGVGYNMVIFLAGLQDISPSLLEAAHLDGANDRQIFFRITLPLLRPLIGLVLTLETIAALRIFGQVQLMTAGGPGGRSATIVSYIYSTGFQRFDLGYAAVLSLLLFFTTLFFSWVRYKFYGDLDD